MRLVKLRTSGGDGYADEDIHVNPDHVAMVMPVPGPRSLLVIAGVAPGGGPRNLMVDGSPDEVAALLADPVHAPTRTMPPMVRMGDGASEEDVRRVLVKSMESVATEAVAPEPQPAQTEQTKKGGKSAK